MLPPVFGVVFDGLAYGMLLFLLSVGQSVTLGMMNFINLAHCSFAMLGGYVTVALMKRLGLPFLATLPCAFVVAAIVSIAFERTLFRRLYRASELDQVLLTIGIVFISIGAAAYFFGTDQLPLLLPPYLRESLIFLGTRFAVYRLFLLGIALVITIVLVLALEYTRFGARVRAAVDNERMARGLGINVDRTFAVTFALGSGLAGLGAHWRSKSSDSIRILRSPISSTFSLSSRSAASARLPARSPRQSCSVSATSPGNITSPSSARS